MKFLKPIGNLLFVILTGAVVFFFWASSKTVSNNEYNNGYIWETNKIETKAKKKLSIITYNVGFASGLSNNQAVQTEKSLFDKNLKAIKDVLSNLQPDFIATQEIDIDSKRSYNINQVKEISKKAETRYAAFLPNWNKRYVPFPYWPPAVHYGKVFSGQSFHSKYPINYQKRHNLQQPLDKPYHYNKLYLSRLFQECEVQIGEKKLLIINVHLEPFSIMNREKQAKLLVKLYNKHKDKAVIILGDMNSLPPYATKFKGFPDVHNNDDYTGDNSMETIFTNTNLKSAITKEKYEKNPLDAFTFYSESPSRKLDYILYNDKIEPITARVITEAKTASDHLPVYFEFSIK